MPFFTSKKYFYYRFCFCLGLIIDVIDILAGHRNIDIWHIVFLPLSCFLIGAIAFSISMVIADFYAPEKDKFQNFIKNYKEKV